MKYLSREDLENISERVIKAYRNLPDIVGTTVYNIDPDKLITEVLKIKLDYHHLSLDGSVLGLTTSSDYIEFKLFDNQDKEEYCVLDGNTILIEKDMKNDISKKGRCNFTKAHEAGHQILKMLFPKDYGGDYAKIHFCMAKKPKNKAVDWEEWQANTIASALLMPIDILRYALYLFGFDNKIEIIDRQEAPYEYEQFSSIADFLGVSKTALSIRLSQLNMVKINNFNKPYTPKPHVDNIIDIF